MAWQIICSSEQLYMPHNLNPRVQMILIASLAIILW